MRAGQLAQSTCATCGKYAYSTKALAKRAHKGSPSNGHPSYYKCGQYWHWGHLADPVINGLATRDIVYAGEYTAPKPPSLHRPDTDHLKALRKLRAKIASGHGYTGIGDRAQALARMDTEILAAEQQADHDWEQASLIDQAAAMLPKPRKPNLTPQDRASNAAAKAWFDRVELSQLMGSNRVPI